jgi:type II secretory pathway pseudopilin PulG
MSMMTEKNKIKRQREGSFTLIETVIALSLITALIIEVASVQGNSIVFSEYSRNVTKATWLARRVMSQVEYQWGAKPFKELEVNEGNGKFEDEPDFTYSIEIKEWKFPFKEMLAKVMGGGSLGPEAETGEKEEGEDSGQDSLIDAAVTQIFGSEPIFMTAFVQVFWAEGAQRNESSLTYLLTNQKKLDEFISTKKATWDKLTKPPPPPKKGTPGTPGAPGAAGNPGAPGGGPGKNPDGTDAVPPVDEDG